MAEGVGEGFVPPDDGIPLEGEGLAVGAAVGAGEAGIAPTVPTVETDEVVSDFELNVGILISLLQLIKPAEQTNEIK